jgi:triosephosphate isomerase
LDESGWNNVIIAYEPIWALNTGKISSADQTQEGAENIRGWLEKNCSKQIANQTRIVYGGPITETNTENLIKLKDVDGFLVGSTSTKPVFRNIFDIVNA